MQCPLCLDPALDVRLSHGIEVDVCPNCGGVYDDRVEWKSDRPSRSRDDDDDDDDDEKKAEEVHEVKEA